MIFGVTGCVHRAVRIAALCIVQMAGQFQMEPFHGLVLRYSSPWVRIMASVRVGFVVENMVTGQDSLKVFTAFSCQFHSTNAPKLP